MLNAGFWQLNDFLGNNTTCNAVFTLYSQQKLTTMNDYIKLGLAACLGGLLSVGIYKVTTPEHNATQSFAERQRVAFTDYFKDDKPQNCLDFTAASQLATPGVVHIKSISTGGKSSNKNGFPEDDLFAPFRDFFGDNLPQQYGPREGTGSGVILSQDGYVVTNNHVVENANTIQVTLHDNRTYTATVIGTDPSTDLALLKIKETGLPYLNFGDSDKLVVGEWVLAVGNPFNLTSTVTAGIVSAKGRSINILNDKFRIESFIQTDAAVNPGNSGGALVNTRGELVGINTAIATQTGSYSGYSFAVPSAIVQKVVDDLLKYGEVQRGFLGVVIKDVDAKIAEDSHLKEAVGVFIEGVNAKSAAEVAGLEVGDVIIKIGDVRVNRTSELQEQIGKHRPGDKVKVTYIRAGKEKTTEVVLKNKAGNTEVVKKGESEATAILGAEFKEPTEDVLKKLDLNAGIQVSKLLNGKLKEAGVREGFVITHIDKREVYTIKDIERAIADKSGGILIEGKYPTGTKAYYAIGF